MLRRIFSRKHGLPGGWGLFKRSLSQYRASVGVILPLVLIVDIPVSLLTTYVVDPTADSSASAYITLAQVAMLAALLYAVVRLARGKAVTVRQAYYEGSALLVRLLLLSVLLLLMLIPLIIGGFILSTGVIAPDALLAPGEQALLILIAVLVSIPSLILFARGYWSVFVLAETDKGPIEAVRVSRRISKDKVWPTLGRLALLALLLVAVLIIPVGILGVAGSIFHLSILFVLLQILTAVIVLPITNFYLYFYYVELQK
jgi:hypothetical protein